LRHCAQGRRDILFGRAARMTHAGQYRAAATDYCTRRSGCGAARGRSGAVAHADNGISQEVDLKGHGFMSAVLITGTSTGIGAATTKVLAARGYRVFATMRDLKKAEPLELSLDQAGIRGNVEFERLDITDVTSIREAVTATLSRAGNQLYAVVHNAGVAAGGAFEDLPQAEVRRVMETNFFGVLELTRQVLPFFRAQGCGRIVLVSSEAAFAGQPANSIYCASKFALEGWAESLTYELEPFGLDIILIEPGTYRTPIWERSPRINPLTSPYHKWMQLTSEAADRHVNKRARDPREVAEVIADTLEARRPRLRYPVGPEARLFHFLRGKVTTSFLRRLIAWYVGVPAARPPRQTPDLTRSS
jgi:NAD(P)-dependent dehydrogenase (short-subunit alcohol dehydrogenase family)